MKQDTLNKTITISYWWKCNKFKAKIPHELKESLEEAATDRITTMMGKGYKCGELSADIHEEVAGHKTPEDGWKCHGWWDTSESTVSDLEAALKALIDCQDEKVLTAFNMRYDRAVQDAQKVLKRAKG